MSPKRFSYVLIGVLVLLVGLIVGGAVGGKLILQKQSDKLSVLKRDYETSEQQQTALAQAKKDIERYQDINSIAQSVVPQDKDQAKTVREIVAIAQQNGVPIKSVTFQNSTLGDTKPVAANTGNTSAAADNTAPTTAPTAPKQPTDSQTKTVDGIAGVYALEIQVASARKVSYSSFLKFLESLEKNRRTAHVTAINVSPDSKNGTIDFTLTLNAYVKP